ncbi:hypothetical protein IF2G_04921 [Cordyceps javanica]|nr:hypothetical protein IF2G_04921 [Cordyceps javanica]
MGGARGPTLSWSATSIAVPRLSRAKAALANHAPGICWTCSAPLRECPSSDSDWARRNCPSKTYPSSPASQSVGNLIVAGPWGNNWRNSHVNRDFWHVGIGRLENEHYESDAVETGRRLLKLFESCARCGLRWQ